ncbi:MAG: hypothetical protein V4506_19225 [Bacteroidota bacterium]
MKSETSKVNKNLNTFIIIAAVIIILIAIYFYRSGKKNAEGPQVEYPHGTESIPAGWSPTALVDELKSVMSGLFTFSGTKDDTWKKLRDLPNDDMVIAVYNVFGQKYFGEGKGTLTKWINDEYNYDFLSGVKEGTLARLRYLNLP